MLPATLKAAFDVMLPPLRTPLNRTMSPAATLIEPMPSLVQSSQFLEYCRPEPSNERTPSATAVT